jgi:RNA polymerase sigma-70 factor (ECF subfamily)
MVAKLASHPEQNGMMDFADFRSALTQLPIDQREALILIGAAGFSYEEASVICGCATGTIKSRVSRARALLSEILGGASSDDYGPDATSQAVVKIKPINTITA